jgi:hypothetical protein
MDFPYENEPTAPRINGKVEEAREKNLLHLFDKTEI